MSDRKAITPFRDGEEGHHVQYHAEHDVQHHVQHHVQHQHHEFVRERVSSPAQSTHSHQSSASASVFLEWDPSADVGIEQPKNSSRSSAATSSNMTETEESSEIDYPDVEHAERDIEIMGNMAVAISRMLDKKSSKERLEIIKHWGMELDQLSPLYNKTRSDVKSNPDLLSRKQVSQDGDSNEENQKIQRSSSVSSMDVSKYESKEKSQQRPSIPQIRLLKEREREKSVESFSSSSTVVGSTSKATAPEKMEIEKGHVDVTEEQTESFSPASETPMNPLSDLSSSSNWQKSGLTKSELEFSRKKQGSRNQDQESMHSSSSSMNLENNSGDHSEDEYPPLANSTPKSKHDDTTNGKQIVGLESQSKRSSKNPSSSNSSSTVWVKVHSKNNKEKLFAIAKSKGVQTGTSISDKKDRPRGETRADKYHTNFDIEAGIERSNKKHENYEIPSRNRKSFESPIPTNIEGSRQNSVSTSSSYIWVKDHPSNKGKHIKKSDAKTKGLQADQSISDMEDRQREKIYKKYFDFEEEAKKERRKLNREYEYHHHRERTKSSRGRKPFESQINVEDQGSCYSATSYATSIDNDAPCPICEHLIDEIIRMTRCQSSQKEQKKLIRVIDLHRDEHICKVRAEIQKLEILNRLISDRTSPSPTSTKLSSVSNSEEDIHNKSSNRSHYRHADINDGAVKFKPLNKSKLKPTKVPSKSINDRNRIIDKHLTVEDKVDRLLSAFNVLTSCLVESSDDENCDKKSKQKSAEKYYRNYKKDAYKYQPSISYYVPIQKCYNSYNNEIDAELNKEMPNIQEALRSNNPAFINRARERERIISRIKKERKRREEIKRKWVNENLIYSNGFRRWNSSPASLKLPPRGPTIMSAKEMRELTKKNYRKLPEVQEKIHLKRMDREKRTNRLMSQLFTTNLRRCALRGQLNVEHYKSLIRY